eukprot:PhF_6_TR17021/c0_g1_i1/m.25826
MRLIIVFENPVIFLLSLFVVLDLFSTGKIVTDAVKMNAHKNQRFVNLYLGGSSGFADGLMTSAQFASLDSCIFGRNGLYIVDGSNNRIRMVSPLGMVSTFAGSGTAATTDGTGTGAAFSAPNSICIDSSENLYVGQGTAIRKITSAGVVTTPASALTGIKGVALDTSGKLIIVDAGAARIKQMTIPGYVVSNYAGTGVAGFADAVLASAQFSSTASGIAIDSRTNTYIVADTGNFCIRSITSTTVATYAGTCTSSGSTSGPATTAKLTSPNSVAFDWKYHLYVVDGGANVVRKIANGYMSVVAGSGSAGSTNGYPFVATFTTAKALCFDTYQNTLYVSSGTTLRNLFFSKNRTRTETVTTDMTMSSSRTISDTRSTSKELKTQTWKTKTWTKNSKSLSLDRKSASFTYTLEQTVTVSRSMTDSETINATHTRSKTNDRTATVTKTQSETITDTQSDSVTVPLKVRFPIKPVRKRSLSTLAGDASTSGYVNGAGTTARFNSVQGIAVGAYGVYTADKNNNRIRFVSFRPNSASYGSAIAFAGSGVAATVDGTGTSAKVNAPVGISIDTNRNLYVSEPTSAKIRKITSAGIVSTLVSTGFTSPYGSVVDLNGNLIVCDKTAHMIRQVTMGGVVSAIAGTGSQGFANGAALSVALFDNPTFVAVDGATNDYYVSDTNNNRIRLISGGTVTTLAGSGTAGFANGPAATAQFNAPYGIVCAGDTRIVYVADSGGHRIRKIQNGWVFTVAGTGVGSTVDGSLVTGTLNTPIGLAISSNYANLFVTCGTIVMQIALPLNYTRTRSPTKEILKKVVVAKHAPVPLKRRVDTLAGHASTTSYVDGQGSVARFSTLYGCVTGDLGVYVTDYGNCRLRLVSYSGSVTTFAGSGTCSSVDGTGTGAQFNAPSAIVMDSSKSLYVSDFSSGKIRKVTSAGVVTTYVSSVGTPYSVTLDPAGTYLYVSDTSTFNIRSVTVPGATVATYAGTGSSGSANGAYLSASFATPYVIAFASSSIMYITDGGNHRIRKLTGGQVTTYAGTTSGFLDGPLLSAQFSNPIGLAIDASGNMFVSEYGNYRLRVIRNGWVSHIGFSGTNANADGLINVASMTAPQRICFNNRQNILYVTTASAVRRVFLALNRTVSDSNTRSHEQTLTTTETDDMTRSRSMSDTVSESMSMSDTKTQSMTSEISDSGLSRSQTLSDTDTLSNTFQSETNLRTLTTTDTASDSFSRTHDRSMTWYTLSNDKTSSRTVKEHTWSLTDDMTRTLSRTVTDTFTNTQSVEEISQTTSNTNDRSPTQRITLTHSHSKIVLSQDKSKSMTITDSRTVTMRRTNTNTTTDTVTMDNSPTLTETVTEDETISRSRRTRTLTMTDSPSLTFSMTDMDSDTRSVTNDLTMSLSLTTTDSLSESLTETDSISVSKTVYPTDSYTGSGTDDRSRRRTTSAKLPTRTRHTPDRTPSIRSESIFPHTPTVSPLTASRSYERSLSDSVVNSTVVITPPPATPTPVTKKPTSPPSTTAAPTPEPPTPAPPTPSPTPSKNASSPNGGGPPPPTPPAPTPKPPVASPTVTSKPLETPGAAPRTLVPSPTPSRTPRPVPTYPPQVDPDTDAPDDPTTESPGGPGKGGNAGSGQDTAPPLVPMHTPPPAATPLSAANAFNAFFVGDDNQTKWFLWLLVAGLAFGLIVFAVYYAKCMRKGRPHQRLYDVDVPSPPVVPRTKHHRLLRKLFPEVQGVKWDEDKSEQSKINADESDEDVLEPREAGSPRRNTRIVVD